VTAGRYVTAAQAAYWDGKGQTGEAIASGTYLYQLQAGDYTETRKMVILKLASTNIVTRISPGVSKQEGFFVDWRLAWD